MNTKPSFLIKHNFCYFLLLFNYLSYGQTDLFFSEYVEGTGANHCIEIFNPTNQDIVLSGNYSLQFYFNGSSSPIFNHLEGVISARSTHQICGTQLGVYADEYLGTSFNGNDAFALVKNGSFIDVFGTIGCDPGTGWSSGGISTTDVTLRRKPCVNKGSTSSGGCTFSGLSEWQVFPVNTFNNLGTHNFGNADVKISGSNALCQNPSIQLTVPSGFKTYKWSTGSTANSITVDKAGTYRVTVTTAAGCEAKDSKQVKGNSPEIFAEITNIKDVSCLPKTDGGFTVVPSGGSPGFSYSWETGSSNSPVITGLGAGKHIITVTDKNGCTIEKEGEIGGPFTISMSVDTKRETCKGQGDGRIIITASGDNLQYSIDGTNFQSSNTFEDLIPGDYRAIVIDNTGCGNEQRETVESGTRFTLRNSIVKQQECEGTGSGQIILIPDGGLEPYLVSFDGAPFERKTVFSNLKSGIYDIAIRDGSGCEKTFQQEIKEGSKMTVDYSLTPASCKGVNDGGISIKLENTSDNPNAITFIEEDGGFSIPYFKPESNPKFRELGVGKYELFVRDYVIDGFECLIPIEFEINEKTPITTNILAPTPCRDDQFTSITVEPQNGTPPFQFSLDNGSFAADNVFDNLIPQPYVVTTQDAIGCTKIDSVEFGIASDFEITGVVPKAESCPSLQDGRITIFTNSQDTVKYSLDGVEYIDNNIFSEVAPGDYTVFAKLGDCVDSRTVVIEEASQMTLKNINPKIAKCEGEADGQLTITVEGGKMPYQYLITGGSLQSSNTFTNLVQGTYTITVIDSNLCKQTFANIILPGPVRLGAICDGIQNVTTNGGTDGSVSLTIFGGASPYEVQLVDAGFNNIISLDGTETLDNLRADNYQVLITDSNDCTATCDFTITEPECSFSLNPIQNNATCFGYQDGAISLNLPLSNEPYTISWSDAQYDGEESISNLAAGIYEVTVSTSLGCKDSHQISISEPAALTVDIQTNNTIICEKDSTQLFLTKNYTTYLWSNNITNSATTIFTEGIYGITVHDALGCMATDEITIGIIAQDTIYDTKFTCDENSVGTFMVEERGADGCMDIVFRTFQLVEKDTTRLAATTCNPLDEGVFYKTLNNVYGCDSTIITIVSLLRRDSINLTAQSCNSDEVGLSYQTLTNAVGCDSVLVTMTTLNTNIKETQLIAYTCNPNEARIDTLVMKTFAGCDSLVITDYQLLRRDSTNLTAQSCNSDEVGLSFQTLTNAVGCDSVLVTMTTLNTNIKETQLIDYTCNPNEARIDTLVMKTFAGCDSLVITDYQLLRRDSTNLTAQSCNSDEVGLSYQTLTNAVGCDSVLVITTTLNTNIKETQLIAYTCNPNEARIDTLVMKTFAGCDSLVITEIISNASEPTFLTGTACNESNVRLDTFWMTNQFSCDSLVIVNTTLAPTDFISINNQSCNPLDTGLLLQNLINQFGCDSIIETHTNLATINDCHLDFSVIADTVCADETIGTVQITINAGIPPYEYFVIADFDKDTILRGTINSINQQIENIPVGAYSILMVNPQHISHEEQIKIIQTPPLNIEGEFSDYNGFAISCEGETDGSIQLIVDGGKTPYTYLWESGEQIDKLTNLSAGNYVITVMDADNCSQVASFELANSIELSVDYQLFSPNCHNASVGSLTINDLPNVNGKAEYSLDGILFQSINNLPFSINNLVSGRYELYVQDENDCQTSAVFEIPTYSENQLTIGDQANLNLGDRLAIVPKANFTISRYEWKSNAPLPCLDCEELNFIPSQNGTYTLTAYDVNGCNISASINVRLKKENQVFLPNVFSPNGDGLNDMYQIFTGDSVAKLLNFRIFDYEGRLMYQVKNRPTNDSTVGWNGVFNGKKMLPAVFVVFAEVELLDGTTRAYSQPMTLIE